MITNLSNMSRNNMFNVSLGLSGIKMPFTVK